MQTAVTFKAEGREKTGKGSARSLRRNGQVPAIVYAKGETPFNLAVEEKALKLAYHKGSFFSKIVSIEAAGKTFQALPKDIQLHPVTDRIEHVDFLKVEDNAPIHVLVPVRFLNQERSIGLKRGGVLNIVRHELELVCLPKDIPHSIEIDVADANIGDSIHISHVKLPNGVQPAITDRDFTIATVAGRSSKEESDTGTTTAEGDAAAATPAAAAEKK